MRWLLPLPFLFLAGCSVSVHLHSNWAQVAWLSTEPVTEQKTLRVECPPEATTMRAELTANGTTGELALRLVDPAGIECHHQIVRRGECAITQQWPVHEGVWTLHVTATDFAGSYSLSLATGDEPINVQVQVVGDPPR